MILVSDIVWEEILEYRTHTMLENCMLLCQFTAGFSTLIKHSVCSLIVITTKHNYTHIIIVKALELFLF